MGILVSKQIIKHYHPEELLHLWHPCRHKLPDGIGYLRIVSVVFEIAVAAFLRHLQNGGKVLLRTLFHTVYHVKALRDIHRLATAAETQAIAGGAYAIDLRCNLHGQVLVGRYLFAGGKTQVERCWL